MEFFGIDPSGIIDSIQGAYSKLMPGNGAVGGFEPGQVGGAGFAPSGMHVGGTFTPAVISGAAFKPAGFDGNGQQRGGFMPADWQGAGGFQPSGFVGGGFQPTSWQDPFRPSQVNPFQEAAAQKAAAQAGKGGTGGMNFAGPATGSDNKTLTPEQIDAWIRQTRPNSPLAGMGAYILQSANARNVSVPLALGIMLQESELGTTAGPNMNLGGVTDPARDQGIGGSRAFVPNSSWQQAVDRILDNLNTPLYKGKSLKEQVGTWYLGDPNADLGSTDKVNSSLGHYLDVVSQVYQALGVSNDPSARPVSGGGVGGSMTSIWGGGQAGITQEFGDTDYSATHSDTYDYGGVYGVHGHTGLDIGVGRGTRLYAPVGGTITIAGTGGYFRDEDYGDDGNSGQRGEIMLTLDNGDEIILGHTSQINVRAGQRVNAGDLLGLSGSANGDHLHLEVRRVDRSMPSGYRIVDPRTYFGGGR